MPIAIMERLPLPTLQTYVAISVGLLSVGLLSAYSRALRHLDHGLGHHGELEQPGGGGGVDVVVVGGDDGGGDGVADVGGDGDVHGRADLSGLPGLVAWCMISDVWSVWILVNTACCLLILIAKGMQYLVFGALRVSERQHLKDKFWNFVFYKFIFIFGVLNVQSVDEVVLWCIWFSVLAFMHLMVQLCKDRFEYLSFSPTTPMGSHVRVLSLLLVMKLLCLTLMLVCVVVGQLHGVHTFFFMAAECLLVAFRTMHVLIRYAIHLWDLNQEGTWENKSTYVYYTDLIMELMLLCIDLMHHIHMLLFGNIWLSMASLVIFMQLRYLLHEVQRRIRRHKNYLQVVGNMEARFAAATPEELASNNDDCAICWDAMQSARKLPCGHLFHNACLRSWLEQDTSCRPRQHGPAGRRDGRGGRGRRAPHQPAQPLLPLRWIAHRELAAEFLRGSDAHLQSDRPASHHQLPAQHHGAPDPGDVPAGALPRHPAGPAAHPFGGGDDGQHPRGSHRRALPHAAEARTCWRGPVWGARWLPRIGYRLPPADGHHQGRPLEFLSAQRALARAGQIL